MCKRAPIHLYGSYIVQKVFNFSRAFIHVCAHIFVSARMKVGAQVARTRKTSLTRIRSSSTRISLHICARPYWCFRNNTDLRKKKIDVLVLFVTPI